MDSCRHISQFLDAHLQSSAKNASLKANMRTSILKASWLYGVGFLLSEEEVINVLRRDRKG